MQIHNALQMLKLSLEGREINAGEVVLALPRKDHHRLAVTVWEEMPNRPLTMPMPGEPFSYLGFFFVALPEVHNAPGVSRET